MLVVLGLTLGLSVAQANDKKRTPATPPGAVGLPMPKPPGSGMPPGAVGMPLPPDASCRRAAGMAAVKEALENNDNNEDCSVSGLKVTKANSTYEVTVACGEDDREAGEETVYTVKTRLKSKKTNACRATSVVVKE